MKNAKEYLHQEQAAFFKKLKEYEDKYSEIDEEGNMSRAIMSHKGYNFSMSYDALEIAMQRYAEDYHQAKLKESGELEEFVCWFNKTDKTQSILIERIKEFRAIEKL